jgi:thiamine-phosphate diphosphorylase
MELAFPILCLVTDRAQCEGRPLAQVVERAVSGGVNLVQLREKDLPASRLLELACAIREITRGRALLFINDRVDVALACEADGVQLGEEGLPTLAARRIAGERLLIGRSVHSAESARKAEADGAHLLVLGTVFPSGSHPGGETGGLARVRETAAAVSVPVVAIGGITASNAASVMEAGASGVAVISALTKAPDPSATAKELVSAMKASWLRRKTG